MTWNRHGPTLLMNILTTNPDTHAKPMTANKPNPEDNAERYRRNFTDDGRWYVEDTATGQRIAVDNRMEGAFVLAEILDDEDPAAAFAQILAELGALT